MKALKKYIAILLCIVICLTNSSLSVLADSIDTVPGTETEEGVQNVEEGVQGAEPDMTSADSEYAENDSSSNMKPNAEGDSQESESVGALAVGDGVTADFDSETGAVVLYSNGGTLWKDWMSQAELSAYDICSIEVASTSGKIYLPVDSSEIFRDCVNMTALDFSHFDTSNVRNMYYMFFCDENLTSLNLSSFDTSNVTDMSFMFSGCTNLSTLDLSGFDTSNVTSMGWMFEDCTKLTSLDLSSFNTSNVTSMDWMFYGCRSLTNLDLSSFNTSNVMSMGFMFSGCTNLTSLDLSGFDTLDVMDMGSMFSECSNLTSLDLSSFDTSNVTSMSYMFSGCTNLTVLNLSSFDTPNVMEMQYMFSECSNLTSLDLSSFDTSNVTDMGFMFSSCTNLSNLDLSSFDTSNVIIMNRMFIGCSNLANLDLSSFDTSNVRAIDSMFKDCNGLATLKTPGNNSISIPLPITMYDSMGAQYTYLPTLSKSITLTSSNQSAEPGTGGGSQGSEQVVTLTVGDGVTADFDAETGAVVFYSNGGTLWKNWINKAKLHANAIKTIRVASTSGKVYLPVNSFEIFRGCSQLNAIDLSNFDTSNVTSMGYMFANCNSLTNLDLSSFNTSNVENMEGMFYWCKGLTNLDLSSFNTSNVESMARMFYGCEGLTNLDLSSFNTSNVVYIDDMFYRCKSLTNLDLSNFDTSNVIEMGGMFSWCTGLTNLDLSGFNTSNNKYTAYMFYGCTSLTNLDLSSFDTSNVIQMTYMFADCHSLTNLDLSSFDTSNVRWMENMFKDCNSLATLKTPGNNSIDIKLPITMYDSTGAQYTSLPKLSKSITLTSSNTSENPRDYKVYRSTEEYESFDRNVSDIIENQDPYTYNPQLAHMLACFANAAYDYKLITRSLEDFGFSNIAPYEYDSPTYGEDNVAYAFAKQPLSDGSTLIMVAIRGSYPAISLPLSSDWRSNFFHFLSSTPVGGVHEGFNTAMNKVYTNLMGYLQDDAGTDYKFVITGHSRAAAVGNLLERKLIDDGYIGVYGYNFACPDVIRHIKLNPWEISADSYKCIFNINNAYDIVSVVPGMLLNTLQDKISLFHHGLLEWDKFGVSRWFFGGQSNMIKAHDMPEYISYLRNEYDISSYKSRGDAPVAILMNASSSLFNLYGPSIGIHCPVDVNIKDETGEVIAAVINDEPVYYTATEDDLLILLNQDEKVIIAPGYSYIEVEAIATDTGEMSVEMSPSGPWEWEKVISSTEIEEGEHFACSLNDKYGGDQLELTVIESEKIVAIVNEDGTREAVETVGSGSCGEELTWELNSLGILYISGSGEMTDYSSAEDVPWKDYKESIKKVEIGNDVSSIGDYAFSGCPSLSWVDFKAVSVVERIGKNAFSGCSSLANIELPVSVTIIDESAFQSCSSLESVDLPSEVTSIGALAFCDCAMSSITIPDSVTSIGPNAFGYRYDSDQDIYTAIDGFVVNGAEGTAAEAYAAEHGLPFGDINSAEEETVIIKSANVEFQGEIRLKFSFVFPESVLADEGAYVTFEKAGTTTTKLVSEGTADGDEVSFIIPVPATEYADDIVVRVYDGEDNQLTLKSESGTDYTADGFTYSARSYARISDDFYGKNGTQATFHIEVEGSENVTYQWQYRTAGMTDWKTPGQASAKTADYSFKLKPSYDNIEVRCIVSNDSGNEIISETRKANVFAFTSQPKDAIASAGEVVNFEVSAIGNNITYQWYYKRPNSTWKKTTVAGATTAVLPITAGTKNDGTSYRCVITDEAGNKINSSAALLTLNDGTTLEITGISEDAYDVNGQSVTFHVDAAGNGDLTYQWQYKLAGETKWRTPAQASAKTPDYVFKLRPSYDNIEVRCIVKDAAGNSVTSDVRKANVFAITGQPEDAELELGEQTTFSVEAAGKDLAYQWFYMRPEGSWKKVTVAGSNTANLVIKANTKNDGTKFRCRVTDGLGNVLVSSAALLTQK